MELQTHRVRDGENFRDDLFNAAILQVLKWRLREVA